MRELDDAPSLGVRQRDKTVCLMQNSLLDVGIQNSLSTAQMYI